MPLLAIPTTADENQIQKAFLTDLESFTFQDEVFNKLKPIICSICDSMPTKAQWSTFVNIQEFTKLCTKGKIRKTDSPEKLLEEPDGSSSFPINRDWNESWNAGNETNPRSVKMPAMTRQDRFQNMIE